MKEILLAAINAKWIHPSLALRLLKANLGSLEERCEIAEFNLRQPLAEKVSFLLAAHPKILGLSVSIWNHTVTLQLLEELQKTQVGERPVIVLGGPEVSHLPEEAEIFKYADYVIRGEGETAFKTLCETILEGGKLPDKFINAEEADVTRIKSAYHLYTDEDINSKLTYVEASRGCPFNCEFCLSAGGKKVREFPLEPFLFQMNELILRGVKTFKFLDRTFNVNIDRAVKICEFFLKKIKECGELFTVHFEIVPSLLPQELLDTLAQFPPGTLRLEIGIQTLNAEISSRIGRISNSEKELANIKLLREKTHAIIHADLIAGLPGEDFESFGRGLNDLWSALYNTLNGNNIKKQNSPFEIQIGILKLLPGALISHHNETFAMKYNQKPPYEIEETSAMSADDLKRIKNFARFWELIVNRGLINLSGSKMIFDSFMELSDSLFIKFGRNWGIDKHELIEAVKNF